MNEYIIFSYKFIRTHSISSGRKLSLIWFKQQRRNKIHRSQWVYLETCLDPRTQRMSSNLTYPSLSLSLCIFLSQSLCLCLSLSALSLCLALFSDSLSSCSGPRQHQAFILKLQTQHKDLCLTFTEFSCIMYLSLSYHCGQRNVLLHLPRPESQDHTPFYPCMYL